MLKKSLAKKLLRGVKNIQGLSRKAGRTGYEVCIDENDIINAFDKQCGTCYWSGIKFNPELNKISYHPLSISVERIDNNVGYIPSNIVLAIRLFNLGKNRYDSNLFPEIIQQLREEFRCQNYSKM